jgi:hypothetical protein
MFAAIRQAMNLPLARPPGRRSWFVLLGPAWWAALVYGAFLAGFLWGLLAYYRDCIGSGMAFDMLPGTPVMAGLIVAWPLAAVILFVGAIVSGAMALAPEHTRGTMDALLMTPGDHARLVRGRYWHGLAPWLRFFAYLLPLYAILAGSWIFSEASRGPSSDFWVISAACGFSNKAVVIFAMAEELRRGALEWGPWSTFLAAVRLANDLSVLLLAYTVAFRISAQARGSGRALALSCLLVPAALILVLAPHDMVEAALLLSAAFGRPFDFPVVDIAAMVYGVLGLCAFLLRWPLAWWLYRSARRNFERWAAGGG